MATTSSSSSSWMLILACLIVLLCKECHSLTEYNLYLEAEDLIYNPEFRENHVHRSVRQAVDNTPVTENITKVDNHNYYRVTYHSGVNNEGSRYWVDLTQLKAKKHPNLSTNPRLAAKLPLEFEFPYYGHNVTELFLTTGGFMYLGSYVHRYLAATQYIAPLMANFDPASSVNCSIKYFSNGSLFISEWTNIQLGDNPLAGLFSFQSTLRDNGEITFAYKKIPIPIANISDEAHPMKTGIADAFYIDQKLSQWIKKRTIYEYHRVALDTTYVNNATAVTITPLPTCNLHKDCESCANSKISFNCSWCSTAKRCSDDGLDRHRQSWINAECDKDINIADVPYNCPLPTIRPTTRAPQSTMGKHPSIYTDCSEGISCFNGGACRYGECICPTLYTGRRCERYVPRDGKGNQMAREGESKDDTTLALRIGTIVGSVVIGVLVLVLVGWLVYAYRYPNSNSGLFLIEITKFRLRKKEENGVGYHYHKPDDNDEVDIII
ncbi:plexin domain-containing protein 2-like isoform X2 [Lytechinus variegatus]|uniref:plexin domain-containing protein 2-like isoform X2 n=1 Tax=Lytechinus variegatus TaxID=7654 RepID=UPI001BB29B0F|nr:plexin domain-containing protein 2-like isoform X2 [Lytechinus variegatus]